MTHSEFNHLLSSIKALSPEQMRQLRRELDGELAGAEIGRPAAPTPQAPEPIWERIQDLTADVPDEGWDRLPTDLAEQHDHCIYGVPKRPTSRGGFSSIPSTG